MYNILYEDLLPIHLDIYKQVYGLESHILHFFHMDHAKCKDLSIDCWCKLCCLDILCHVGIHLF